MSIKELGQYFTINKKLQSFVFKKVKHKSKPLLEPSFGAGHLLKLFKEYRDDYLNIFRTWVHREKRCLHCVKS